MIGEFAAIGLVRKRLGAPGASSGVMLGAGDDCAQLASGDWPLLAVDTLVEGVHWDPGLSRPADVGFKLLSCNLSDMAAMAGAPGPFLLAMTLAAPFDSDFVEGLAEGLCACRRAHGLDPEVVTAIGGDTTRAAGGAVLSLTLLGRPAAGGRVLRRSGARPGDTLWVSGPLGQAAAGLALLQAGRAAPWATRLEERHRRPGARLDLVPVLAETPEVHAAIDLSDGLAGDLGHILRASGASAELAVEQLPLSSAVHRAAALLGEDPTAWALAGGEDYELLVSAGPGASEALSAAGLSPIGRVTSAGQPGAVVLVDARGRATPLERGGYEHGES